MGVLQDDRFHSIPGPFYLVYALSKNTCAYRLQPQTRKKTSSRLDDQDTCEVYELKDQVRPADSLYIHSNLISLVYLKNQGSNWPTDVVIPGNRLSVVNRIPAGPHL